MSLHLTILHTNDMHARLEAMARLSTYAHAVRAELEAQGRHVLFCDAGDAADRAVRFCGATKGAAFPRILAAMQYDWQTLGNAISVTYGPQAAAQMAARAPYPILAANFFDSDGRALLPGFRSSLLIDLGEGLRLGVIGLTVDAPDLYALFGVPAPDFLAAARREADALRAAGASLLIAVTHLGLREDRLLAEALPELALIVGGHSHTLLSEGEQLNGVLIAQTGSYAENLGRVDLEIDPAAGAVLSKSARLLPVPADTPPDPAVLEAVRAAEAEAAETLARPLFALSEPLGLDHFGVSPVAELAAEALRQRMGAECAILTSGLFHSGLPAGVITLGMLDAACFTTANPQLSQVRGEQLRAAVERALDPDLVHATLKMFRGTPVGLPAFAGMQVVWNESGVQSLTVQGQPLDAARLYRVAHTDAEVKEGPSRHGYLELEPGQLLHTEVPTILREVVEEYLRQ